MGRRADSLDAHQLAVRAQVSGSSHVNILASFLRTQWKIVSNEAVERFGDGELVRAAITSTETLELSARAVSVALWPALGESVADEFLQEAKDL